MVTFDAWYNLGTLNTVQLDLKKVELQEERGKWFAPLGDALAGQSPRKPRSRWQQLAHRSGRQRTAVEPLGASLLSGID